MPRHRLLYTEVESLLGGLQQTHNICRYLAHGKRIGAIGVKAVQADATVESDDITVLEHRFLRRYAVYDLLVDRGAKGAGKTLIALAGRYAAVVTYILLSDSVQLSGSYTRLNVLSHFSVSL